MKNLKSPVILLTILVLFASCSVQKRYHRKGYTVNWNKVSLFNKKTKNNVAISIDELSQTEASIENQSASSSMQIESLNVDDYIALPVDVPLILTEPVESLQFEETPKLEKDMRTSRRSKVNKSSNLTNHKRNDRISDPTGEDEEKVPYDQFALIGFILCMLTIVGFWPCLLWALAINSIIPMSLLLLVGLAGIVLSRAGLVNIRNSKKKYKGKTLAIVGLVVMPIMAVFLIIYALWWG